MKKALGLEGCGHPDRFEYLRSTIDDYLSVKDDIKTGLEASDAIRSQKDRIMKKLGASEEQWSDYKWQLANRFTSVEDFEDVIPLSREEKEQIAAVGKDYRFAI